jgi:hypothetical protein
MPELRRSRRVDPVVHRNRGVWNPDLVGYPGYPKTKEAFEKRQQQSRDMFARMKAEGRHPNRRGVPNGFAGSREEIDAGRAAAREFAKKAVEHMKRTGEMLTRAPKRALKPPLKWCAQRQRIRCATARTTCIPWLSGSRPPSWSWSSPRRSPRRRTS